MCSHIKKTVNVLQISSKQQVRMCDRDRKMFLLMLLITVLPELCDSDQECVNHFDIPTFTGSLGKYCEETLHSLNCSVGVSNSDVSSFSIWFVYIFTHLLHDTFNKDGDIRKMNHFIKMV